MVLRAPRSAARQARTRASPDPAFRSREPGPANLEPAIRRTRNPRSFGPAIRRPAIPTNARPGAGKPRAAAFGRSPARTLREPSTAHVFGPFDVGLIMSVMLTKWRGATPDETFFGGPRIPTARFPERRWPGRSIDVLVHVSWWRRHRRRGSSGRTCGGSRSRVVCHLPSSLDAAQFTSAFEHQAGRDRGARLRQGRQSVFGDGSGHTPAGTGVGAVCGLARDLAVELSWSAPPRRGAAIACE